MFFLVLTTLINVRLIPIERVFAHPTEVSVSPSSVVDTGLTPAAPGEPYELTLKATGDVDPYRNWTGNRGLRPTADGGFTDWSTGCAIRPDGDGTYTNKILRPDGDGTYTAWDGTYVDWDDVTSDGVSSYVNISTPDLNESSTLTNPSSPGVGNINSVIVTIIARILPASNDGLRVMLVIGGVGYNKSFYSPSTSFAPHTTTWETNPATASAWTWSEIDTLEAGVRSEQVGAGWKGEIQITQLYVTVDVGDWTGTYEDWDEVTPDGGTSYVRATAGGLKESSTLESPASTIGTIAKVRVVMVAKNQSAHKASVKLILVIGGTVYEGTSYAALTSDYLPYASEWATNPATASAWTWSDITSLEAGVKSVALGAWSGQIRVTQLYVDILTTTSSQDYMYWDDSPIHNWDEDYVQVSGDDKNETSQMEDHTGDDTFDIGKVRVVAYARANETTDDELVLALAVPPPSEYESHPSSHLPVSQPSKGIVFESGHEESYSYDGDMGTYTEFNYETPEDGSYLELVSFGTDTGTIVSVDFKMKYEATVQIEGGAYEIKYSTDSWSNEVSLVGPTGVAHSVPGAGYDEWSSQDPSQGGSWTWTDIGNIEFRVETTFGRRGEGMFKWYESWVTVNLPTGSVNLYLGQNHTLTTTYQKYTSEWPWNPSGGSAWSWSAIDNLQAGVATRQVGGSWTGEIRVTQLSLEVVGGVSIRPDGDSSYHTDWIGSYGDWNETSFHNGDTNYVKADYTVGDYMGESSTLQNPGSKSWEIEIVRVVMYARAEGTTDERVYLMLYDAGWWFEYTSDVGYTPTSTYQRYTWEWSYHPETFERWAWSDIASLEAGVFSEEVGGSWQGEIRVTQLYVEIIGGTGSYKAWDEYPTHNSDSDYLSAVTRGLFHTSQLEDHTSETWGIARVRVTLVARVTDVDAEPEKVAPVISIGGTKYDGVYSELTANYTSYTSEWGLRPDTGALWAWSDIDSLEAGAASEMGGGTWTGEIRVTQIYVTVSGPGFKVDIQVDTVTNLWQYAFEVFYNPDLIRGVWAEPDCPHRVGAFLGSAGGTPTENAGTGFNHTVGWLKFTGAYLAETGDPSKCPDGGPGVLGTIVFEVLRRGNTTLRLGEQTVLFDHTGTKIIEGRDYVADGKFRNIDSNLIPTADFTYSPVSTPQPLEGHNVTFTNSSTPASGKTIDVCRWYFWRMGSFLRELHIPIITSESSVTRNCTARGSVNVTLNVFDSDGVVGSTSDWLTIQAHDVYFNAIYYNSSRSWLPSYPEGKVEIDKTLEVKAEVINEGDFTETNFDVSCFWTFFQAGVHTNGTIGTKQTVTSLAPGAMQNVTFLWDTTGFSLTHPDRYSVHANASKVQYEWDTERTPTSLAANEYEQGAPRFRLHDMAVTDNPPAEPPPLDPASGTTVSPGDPVEVTVTVTNQGDFNESSLTIKTWAEKQGASPIPIHTETYPQMTNKTFSDQYIANQPPYEDNYTRTYTFIWDTTTFSGNYTIWSNVTIVTDDYETGDNTYIAGWIQVVPAVPEFPLGVAVEIALVAVIVYVWWHGRRKAKHLKNPTKFPAS